MARLPRSVTTWRTAHAAGLERSSTTRIALKLVPGHTVGYQGCCPDCLRRGGQCVSPAQFG